MIFLTGQGPNVIIIAVQKNVANLGYGLRDGLKYNSAERAIKK